MSRSYAKIHIASVVVTYNRLALLKECIHSLRSQSRKIDEIIVVNNSSTDGTEEWLERQKDLAVITQENSGSAGGQYTGIKAACEKNFDWIWCMDDDTVPNVNSLEELIKVVDKKNDELIGFLASKVVWIDGSPHKMNLPGYFYNKNLWNFIGAETYSEGVRNIDVSSFVSCLFKKDAVKEVGLPDKRYFIWFDDLEYTSRFRGFSNYFVSDSVVVHKTKTNASVNLLHLNHEFDFRIYFGLRNFFLQEGQ